MKRCSVRGLIALACVHCAVFANAQGYQKKIDASHAAYAAQGQNAIVVQVEPPSVGIDGQSSAYHYGPVQSHANYKQLTFHIDPAARASKHSEAIGQLLFGKRRSIAKGIKHAYVLSSLQWMRDLAKWDLRTSTAKPLFPGPVISHSWVGVRPDAQASEILKRVDLSAYGSNIVHVTGVRKKGIGQPLLSGAYNTISVGSAHQNIETPYAQTAPDYGQGRFRPHLVAPFSASSAAVPVVAAAVIRLNALAAHLKLSVDSGRADNHQLPAELSKAILMSSASADFVYEHKNEQLINKFGAFGLTDSGMDQRYGMGMLNVRAAENVLKLGAEKNYNQSVSINTSGYQLLNSPAPKQSYQFAVEKRSQLSVTLAWLAIIDTQSDDQLKLTLPNRDLCLFEVTPEGLQIVAESISTGDSVENIRATLEPGRVYQLVVLDLSEPTTMASPLALAWSLTKSH